MVITGFVIHVLMTLRMNLTGMLKMRIEKDIIQFIKIIQVMIFICVQLCIIPALASPIIFGQDHHTGISETNTNDGIEGSVFAEVDLNGSLSQVLSIKEVLPDHEVLAGVASVAARTSTKAFTYTKSAGKHLTEVVKRGPNAGQL